MVLCMNYFRRGGLNGPYFWGGNLRDQAIEAPSSMRKSTPSLPEFNVSKLERNHPLLASQKPHLMANLSSPLHGASFRFSIT